VDQETKNNVKRLKHYWKVEEDFYAKLKEEITKANLKTPMEIAEFYKDFIYKYKESLRRDVANFKSIQNKIQKEMYLGKIEKEKKAGSNKSIKFHIGLDSLLTGKPKTGIKR
jgi:hypothetical protein